MLQQAIICVDDDWIVLESLKQLLECCFVTQCLIKAVNSGEAALNLLGKLQEEQIEVALVISDQLMPKMKGDELLAQVHQRSPKTLTILLTGHADVEAVGNAVNKANLYRYITKPWNLTDLQLTVAEALRRYTQEQQLAAQTIALQQLNASLEEKVALRTAKLVELNQQLEQAKNTAEAANRLKDEFLAVLSHELRSPLNPILGWTKILKQSTLPPAKTAYALDTIERNARHQVQLIDDLLDMSRILRGKLQLSLSSVDLIETIEAALETVRLAASAKSVQIQLQLDAPIEPIWGDANRLQQVLWNLFSNAIKFTPSAGRVEITLSLEPGNPKNYAVITVVDTGSGISTEFLPYIFEPFRQADSSTTRNFGGLGLGLAIARKIVEIHGGTITAESPGQGEGATFTVRLPLLAAKNLERKSESKNDLADGMHLDGISILVVDDEADSREYIEFCLQQLGATVNVAASAKETFDILTKSQPDILVSDLGMPDTDGYELLSQLRSRSVEKGGQIPAIALTAYASETYEQAVIQSGFQYYLTKPVEPVQLVAAILELIKK